MNIFTNGNNPSGLKAITFLNGKKDFYLYNITFEDALKIALSNKTEVVKDNSYKISVYYW